MLRQNELASTENSGYLHVFPYASCIIVRLPPAWHPELTVRLSRILRTGVPLHQLFLDLL
jgi:hypothetical protein